MNRFINASYINGLIRGVSEKSVIACQAPITKSVDKFWQMVWENKVKLIVMLCPLVGCKGPESMNYWEIDCLEDFTLKVIEKTHVNDKLVLTTLKLCRGGDSLTLQHLNEIGWVDDTAEESLCKDIDYMIEKMLQTRAEHTDSPIIVHCSAGIGRTGTLVAIFNIVESLIYSKQHTVDPRDSPHTVEKYPSILEHPLRVSIFGCVRKLREQRMLMVKKLCQYKFLYFYINRWI